MIQKNKRIKKDKMSVKAKKRFGQNFLTDQSIISKIVDAIAPQVGEPLLEIGPGLGAITLPVLSESKQLIAIELDRRVVPVLLEKAQPLGTLNLIEEDALMVDYSALFQEQKYKVFGNLPYNISTPLLFTLIGVKNISEMIFMLQKEVVDRIVAQPSDNNYGRLSIMLQYHHDVYPLFDVPPESFSPAPKVMSAMVGLSRLAQPRWQVDDTAIFSSVVKAAFSMRRKTLRNNLKLLIDHSSLESLAIDGALRAEVVSGEDFAKIANHISQKTKR